jgi:hypothetical protein
MECAARTAHSMHVVKKPINCSQKLMHERSNESGQYRIMQSPALARTDDCIPQWPEQQKIWFYLSDDGEKNRAPSRFFSVKIGLKMDRVLCF